MNRLEALLAERVLVLDGAMGTQLLARHPSPEDFGGPALEGCMECLNERRPQWIREIHAAYFDAGADAVETNTFGCNAAVLSEFGLVPRIRELARAGARLAREVADAYAEPRFVIGALGPGSKLLTLGQTEPQALFEGYREAALGLMQGGADAILLETCQDPGQIRGAVRAARAAMGELRRALPLWVSVTVETSGTLLLGTELPAVLAGLEPLGIQALGLNCGTGPGEMAEALAFLSAASPLPITCCPNAGMPLQEAGHLVYPMAPEAFAEQMAELAARFGIAVVGGCCGTGPEHIRALAARLGSRPAPRRAARFEPAVTSLYQAVTLRQEPRPLIVGERTNANGSKRFREALAHDDVDAMVEVAKAQQREGAHVLDICVASAGRDERRDLEAFLKRLVPQTTCPLMIDSTELPVLEAALRLVPGRCIVNSINFEDGEARAREVLALCREHGAAVVALTIDEEGMARDALRKERIAARTVDLVVDTFGFRPEDLILDPLTFTLGSGDEDLRGSARETLEAIRRLKARWPGVQTVLGVSNVSFGLAPPARRVLNALMLTHAVEAGLDLAIFDAARLLPVSRIPEDERPLFEDLLFDRRAAGYDPLKEVLRGAWGLDRREEAPGFATRDPLERLRRDVLEGSSAGLEAHVTEALAQRDAAHLLHEVLLPAMQEVGDRFGRGELQLPFVLESAEVMRAAIERLRPHLPARTEGPTARMILATVRGDVHDIGKNLVDILLSNNGFEVLNLGIKQGAEAILEANRRWPAQAIGLSGLLVKSTAVMREMLQTFADHGLELPVILGGAALTPDYVTRHCQTVYPGPVLYAADAFDGLTLMRAIASGRDPRGLATPVAPEAGIRVVRRTPPQGLDEYGRSTWVGHGHEVPTPPFWGVREAAATPEDLFAFLDTLAVFRHRWSFTQGSLSDGDFAGLLRTRAEPVLEAWRARLCSEPILAPRARVGFFPCCAEQERLLVFAPEHHGADPASGLKPVTAFRFPRQAEGRRLCVADFFLPRAGRRMDVVALQLVTLGQATAEYAAHLFAAHRFGDYFYFHGLATELTEAFAERLHAQVRRDLGIHHRDAAELRHLFSQGYQGSRYSFGYPACPDLEGNRGILDLLEGRDLGIHLTESLQMVPEYTTSALVAWHPQARYFAT